MRTHLTSGTSLVGREMTPEDRRGFLRETIENFRKQAREELKRMYPELNAAKGAPPPPPGFAVAE